MKFELTYSYKFSPQNGPGHISGVISHFRAVAPESAQISAEGPKVRTDNVFEGVRCLGIRK